MNNSYTFSSHSQPYNLVQLAQLVMDYEADPDFMYSDIQRGVLTDILKIIRTRPHLLLQTIPTRPVAKALYLAFHRGLYSGKQESEILAAATYYCLSRAMAENPRDMSLYRERYSLMQDSKKALSRPLSIAIKRFYNKLHRLEGYSYCTYLLKMIPQMLLIDLLYAEDFFKEGVILCTARRALMDQLDEDAEKQIPLYQHFNMGLESHELFIDYLEEILQQEEVWYFNISQDSSTTNHFL